MKLKRIIFKDIENSPILSFFYISFRDRCTKISEFIDNSCASFSSKNNFFSFFYRSDGWRENDGKNLCSVNDVESLRESKYSLHSVHEWRKECRPRDNAASIFHLSRNRGCVNLRTAVNVFTKINFRREANDGLDTRHHLFNFSFNSKVQTFEIFQELTTTLIVNRFS